MAPGGTHAHVGGVAGRVRAPASSDETGDGIGDAAADALPIVVSDVVGGASSAAFTGDPARLARLDGIDARIEVQIKPRTERLERQADGFCKQLLELDRIDAALEFRVADGRPLNLLDAAYIPHAAGPRVVRAAPR